VALHIRDAAGWPVDQRLPVPRLVPHVPVDATLDALAGPISDDTWLRWFRDALTYTAEPDRHDNPFAEIADVDLGHLVRQAYPAAMSYASERREMHGRRTHSDQYMDQVVKAAQDRLGRAGRPFAFRMSTLPVTGVWAHQVAPDHVLVSESLRARTPELTEFLEPIIADLM
jgi:hypothetical protein